MLKLPSLGDIDSQQRMKIFYCTSPTDMRKGFDTLAALVRDHLGGDPLSGDLFLFLSRRRDRIKILYWDSDGFAMWYKRLELGTYRLPRVRSDALSVEIKASELAMLLDGIDLRSVKRRRRVLVGK